MKANCQIAKKLRDVVSDRVVAATVDNFPTWERSPDETGPGRPKRFTVARDRRLSASGVAAVPNSQVPPSHVSVLPAAPFSREGQRRRLTLSRVPLGFLGPGAPERRHLLPSDPVLAAEESL